MIVAGTGHRPAGMGNVKARTAVPVLRAAIEAARPSLIISGMALGWDTWLAGAALQTGVPFVAACPGRPGEQSSRWGSADRAAYDALLSKACEVVQVGAFIPYAKACLMRNEYMVDRAALVWACWNGQRGGTAACVRYAKRKNVPVVNFWPVVNSR